MKDINLTAIFDSMKANGISELIIKEGSKVYEVRRGGFKNQGSITQQTSSVVQQPMQQIVQQPANVQPTSTTSETTTDASLSEGNYFEQKSPLVGTFYSSPNPESPPFVEVGDKVVKGQTLCIVEAMKNFNEIESEVGGIIKEICAKNAELVEFGKVLFKIEEK